MEGNPGRFFFIKGVLLFLIGFSLLSYAQVLYSNWPEPKFDDSYMFFRYAKNIADGKGFTWNPGEERIFGPTSILYVFFLSMILKIYPVGAGNLLISVSWFFGLLSLGAIIPACILEARKPSVRPAKTSPSGRFAGPPALARPKNGGTPPSLDGRSGIIVAGTILPLLIFQNVFIFHATTGMDTTFSFLSNTILILAVIFFSGEFNLRGSFLISLCGYLTYLARPDNGIYALLFPVLYFASGPEKLRHRGENGPPPHPCGMGSEMDFRKKVKIHLVFLLGLLSIDFALKMLFFGQAFPLSAYAKSLNFYEGYIGKTYWNPMAYLKDFFVSLFPFILVITMGLERKNFRSAAPFILPVLLTFSYYFTVLQLMGFECRYYCPSIPFLVVAAWKMSDGIIESVQNGISAGTFIPKLIFLALLIVSWWHLNPEEWYSRNFLSEKPFPPVKIGVKSPVRLVALDWWDVIKEMSLFSKELPPGTLFAASEIGFLSAAAPNSKFLDIAGLNDIHIALNGFSADYILGRKPEIIWFPPADSTGVIYKFLSCDRFFREYSYFPEAFNYGVAISKSSPFSGEIMQRLEKSWQKIYPGTNLYDYAGFRLN